MMEGFRELMEVEEKVPSASVGCKDRDAVNNNHIPGRGDCAVTMCGGEGEMEQICSNFHVMHRACITSLTQEYWDTNGRDKSPISCPLCRGRLFMQDVIIDADKYSC